MRILPLLHHRNIIELNIQELVNGLEDSGDAEVVFELDGDFVVDQGFEEASQG